MNWNTDRIPAFAGMTRSRCTNALGMTRNGRGNPLALAALVAVVTACGGESHSDPVDATVRDSAISDATIDATTDATESDADTDAIVETDSAIEDAALTDAATDGALEDAGVDGAVGQATGTPCRSGGVCATGFCVDSVCCEAACDGVCRGCALAVTGAADGTCAPAGAGTDPHDDCGGSPCQSEFCDGRGACTAAADGTVCRPEAGGCDVAETCMRGACPADAVVPAATAGMCMAYVCDGATASCPQRCESPANCAAGFSCVNNACIEVRRVFVTSTTHGGNLAGVAGADRVCSGAATTAGLSGRYRAWLWTTAATPLDRSFVRFAGPYVGTDGVKVADNFTDLSDGTLDAPIERNESGGLATGLAWTGAMNGLRALMVAPQNCMNFTISGARETGTVGMVGQTGVNWTSGTTTMCTSQLHLYCVEQ